MTRLLSKREIQAEWLKCKESPLYFINEYVHIENATLQEWVPFRMWPAQAHTLNTIQHNPLVIVLKARQLGLTWLSLGFALWLMIFKPGAAVGVFSRREEESIDLLDRRLKGMYGRLPEWMQAKTVVNDSKKHWALSNGSWCRAFPTSAGDSYTFTMVLVDEADLAPDLADLLRAVKPTIDAGGWLLLISRVDKKTPLSTFKQIYRMAVEGKNDYTPVFLPWYARPGRDAKWYGKQKADSITNHGSHDYLWEQYPATDTEALAPRSLDKRIPAMWLEKCYLPMDAEMLPADAPPIPLVIYKPPEPGHNYVIGADPAEGNPTSDDSAFTILDHETGEEVAHLAGKYQPAVFASHINDAGMYYRMAQVMVERNNHGHTVLLWLNDYSRLKVLHGLDKKPGWMSSSRGKTMMYNDAADAFRNGDTVIHSFETYTQLASVEGSTLRAPTGQHDDRADSYALALQARNSRPPIMQSALIDFYSTPALQVSEPAELRSNAAVLQMMETYEQNHEPV